MKAVNSLLELGLGEAGKVWDAHNKFDTGGEYAQNASACSGTILGAYHRWVRAHH